MTELSKSKYVMIVTNRLSAIRYKLQHTEFIIHTYLIFLAGFFLSPNNHLHRNFFYLFVIVPFLIGLDLGFIHNCIRSKLFKLSIIFLLYFWASMFWTNAHLTGEEYYDQTRYFLMLVIFIMATMMLSSTFDQFFDKIKFWLCLVASIAAITFAVIFYASNSFPSVRLRGHFAYTENPNQASMYFGFVGVLAFHSVFFKKNFWHKIFNWFVYMTLFGFILLSQSRGPLLAFVMALMIGSILGKSWKTMGIFITLLIVFIVFVEFFDIGIRSFFDRGLSYRVILWKGAIKHMFDAPLFGKGYFADVDMPIQNKMLSPHNLLLLVTAKSGVIGGGLLLLLISTAFAHSYRYFVSSGDWVFLCIFVYFIFCMTFDSTHLLYKPNLGWLIFWMPVALIAGKEIRQNAFA